MTIKEFKNGNINIKLDSDDLETLKADNNKFFDVFFEGLFWSDCYAVGDYYSIGNFSAGIDIYNTRLDLVYRFIFSDIDNLKAGETVKLYGCIPSDEDRENIAAALYC